MVGWREIAATFQTDIEEGRLPEGSVIPSETELAAQWSVSRMTIHRAMALLQEQGFVARKRRVGTVVAPRDARAKRTIPAVRKETRRNRAATIALVIDDQRDRLAIEYVRGVSTALRHSHKLLFFNTEGVLQREAECLTQLEGQVDGIVLFPIGGNENLPLIERVLRSGVPIVALDRDVALDHVSAVTSDNYGASIMALRYLADRGHKRIAHFTWGLRDEPEVRTVVERYDAWHTVMQQNGHAESGRWLRRYSVHASADMEHLTQFANDALFAMLHQPDPPTAVFCVNDYFMAAALQACSDLGINVPGDLEILSFNDGIHLLPRQERAVNRLVQRTEAMGKRAIEVLLAEIADPDHPTVHVRMASDFYPSSTYAAAGECVSLPDYTDEEAGSGADH